MNTGFAMPSGRTANGGRAVALTAIAALLLLRVLTAEASAGEAVVSQPTRHNRSTIAAIGRELDAHKGNAHYCAVLRGLRWCVILNDGEERFLSAFSNYVTMLDELTVPGSPRGLRKIVRPLIRREFRRALPVFGKIFQADSAGYLDFVSVLSTAYRHNVPIRGLKRFAEGHFAGVKMPDRLEEFRKAAQELDYDTLTDIVVEAAFVDMAYKIGAGRDFRLPPNSYRVVMEGCDRIPLVHHYEDDGYHYQNYFATHILLAMNHYGQKRPAASASSSRILEYLTGQYEVVREKVGDLDLLCEYLYGFRQFGIGAELVAEGERHVLSLQRSDGAWGTAADFNGEPYDQLHPTWTAITLLVLGALR